MCDKKELKPSGLFGNDGCMKKVWIDTDRMKFMETSAWHPEHL